MNKDVFFEVDLLELDPQKPVIVVPGGNFGGPVSSSLSVKSGAQEVSLKQTSSPNCYYLPWKDGNCTTGKMSLNDPMLYFFTAQLSGCSIWYKYTAIDEIVILHEARTKEEHTKEGFKLVFDSNTPTKWGLDEPTFQTHTSDEHFHQTATFFVVYGAVEKGKLVFYVQQVFSKTFREMSAKSSPDDTRYSVLAYRRIDT